MERKFEIQFSKRYKGKAKKFLVSNPHLYDKYKKTIYPLRTSPFHPSLRLHPLHGKHRDFHSVYIDRRYGIMLEFVIDKGKIILLDIGTHQIY